MACHPFDKRQVGQTRSAHGNMILTGLDNNHSQAPWAMASTHTHTACICTPASEQPPANALTHPPKHDEVSEVLHWRHGELVGGWWQRDRPRAPFQPLHCARVVGVFVLKKRRTPPDTCGAGGEPQLVQVLGVLITRLAQRLWCGGGGGEHRTHIHTHTHTYTCTHEWHEHASLPRSAGEELGACVVCCVCRVLCWQRTNA